MADQNGELCVEGNRKPAWTSASNTYAVKGAWLDKLLRAYKLSLTVYEDYLYCCRDGVATRKRSLDPPKAKHEEQALKREVEERTKLLRADAALLRATSR